MVSSVYAKKSSLTLLLDFLLLVLLFLVFLLGVFVYSINLSKRNGRDLTTIPQQIISEPRNVGTN